MSERSLWKSLREGMRGRWDATRHEDKLNVGIPDVSYGMNSKNGWIELKHVPRCPKRGRIALDLSSAQVMFLKKRGQAGGSCWVFFQVGRTRYLVPWIYAKNLREGVNKELLRMISRGIWTDRVDWIEFAQLIS